MGSRFIKPIILAMSFVLLLMGVVIGGSLFSTAFAQQQQQVFIAKLSGKAESPPVDTQATGSAKFTVNPNDTISYEVNAKNVNGVIGAHIIENNGSLLAQVFNPYIVHNGKPGIPTGQINGMLSAGIITSDDLSGPVAGKNVSDLANIMKQGNTFVEIRTQQHENGEIRGQIQSVSTNK